MAFQVISFYKYVDIKHPEQLQVYLRTLCEGLHLLGRILIAHEGVNGAVSGTQEMIEKFKEKIQKHGLFSDLTFREHTHEKNAYHKLVVRVRKEIVAFGKEVDLRYKGTYVTPAVLHEWLDNKEDVVLLDARNRYETTIGKFKNAVTLPIDNFRAFPRAVQQLQDLKEKKIVAYCTGGVRCEKASAYMKMLGFKQVYQLEGGIINYLHQFHDYYEGSCFVFDDRLVARGKEPITQCVHCGKKSDFYLNCHNLDCDQLFVCCTDCQKEMKKTCSEACKGAPRQRQEQQSLGEVVGVVENYFRKPKVALVKLDKDIREHMQIGFQGRTTKFFTQTVHELRDYDEQPVTEGKKGQLVTLPVKQFVRRHDVMMLPHDRTT